MLPAVSLAQFPQQSSGSSSVQQVPFQPSQQAPSNSSCQGSVVDEKANGEVLQLTLDDAIQRGLKRNLGLILTGQNQQSASGQRLQELQGLLPTVDASFKEVVSQINLAADGLVIPGFPVIIGPYGYTDVRATLRWS